MSKNNLKDYIAGFLFEDGVEFIDEHTIKIYGVYKSIINEWRYVLGFNPLNVLEIKKVHLEDLVISLNEKYLPNKVETSNGKTAYYHYNKNNQLIDYYEDDFSLHFYYSSVETKNVTLKITYPNKEIEGKKITLTQEISKFSDKFQFTNKFLLYKNYYTKKYSLKI